MEFRIKPRLIKFYKGIRNWIVFLTGVMIIGKIALAIVEKQKVDEFIFDLIIYIVILIFFIIRFGNALKK